MIFQGTPRALMDDEESITGCYLTGKRSIPTPKVRLALQACFN